MPRTGRVRLILVLVVTLIAVVATEIVARSRTEESRRRDYYRARAESYAWGEAEVLEQIADTLKAARLAESNGDAQRREADALRSSAERLARLGAWHVKLERKYAWAAEHPWEPLPPDPPPPPSD